MEHEVLVDPVIVPLTPGVIVLIEDGLLHDAHVVVVALGVVPHPCPHRSARGLRTGLSDLALTSVRPI